jgi:hypothetical protein
VLYPAELPGPMAIWANENASNMKSQFAHLRHRGVPTPPRASRRIAVFLAAALSLLFLAAGASAGCPVDGGERAMVSSVTDRGEIALADGRVARLAGLDIPDSTLASCKMVRARAPGWLRIWSAARWPCAFWPLGRIDGVASLPISRIRIRPAAAPNQSR